MKHYLGTKHIRAKAMTRGDYNVYRSWKIPADENPADEGYLVEYMDGGKSNHPDHQGYISWSPKEQFENAYKESGKMSFGHALVALKDGEKVARSGWNGKDMFLYFVPANAYPAQTAIAKRHWGEDAKVPYQAYIAMKTVQGTVVPWLCSQTDMLADDWSIVD